MATIFNPATKGSRLDRTEMIGRRLCRADKHQSSDDRHNTDTHTEALQPMAGAVVAGYDALSSACGRANEKAL
jgi:hypothetical protein